MLIKQNKSIIPACDVKDLKILKKIVKDTCRIKEVGAYKIGFELALQFSLKKVVKTIRQLTKKPIIYDHQKAATDIPDTAENFAKVCKEAGVDAVILFPQAGPATEKAWIKSCMKAGLKVIVGGEMTHPCYLQSDDGFISDDAPLRIYSLAASLGVKDFVIPGNKPEKILMYRKFLEEKGVKPIFYSPGLITQGGSISQSAKAAGDNWHAIIGRSIYEAKDFGKAAKEYAKALK